MANPAAFTAGTPAATFGMPYPTMSSPSTNVMSVPSTATPYKSAPEYTPLQPSMPGGAGGMLAQYPLKELPTYGVAKRRYEDPQPSSIPQLLALIVVPTLIFAATFWLNSFNLRYSSEGLANVASYCMVLPAVAFLVLSLNASGAQRFLSLITSACCLAAWVAGFAWGDYNYQSHMRPYYDVSQLNSYPNVNPLKFTGNQLMDAGMIQFVTGSRASDHYSMGFKNGDTYCVAPMLGPGQKGNTTDSFDFWAVGTNCCHGTFGCGWGRWGLRVMDDSKRNMFEVAVKQAEASFRIKAGHPILVYLVEDAAAENQQDSDEGIKDFIFAIFACFACLLVVAVVSAAMQPWM